MAVTWRIAWERIQKVFLSLLWELVYDSWAFIWTKNTPTEQNLHRNSLSFIVKIIFLPPANMNILSLGKVNSTERAAVNLSCYRYSHEACFLLSKPLKTQARTVTNITSCQHKETAEILQHKTLSGNIWFSRYLGQITIP